MNELKKLEQKTEEAIMHLENMRAAEVLAVANTRKAQIAENEAYRNLVKYQTEQELVKMMFRQK